MRCHCRGGNDLRGAIQNSCNPYFYQVFRKFVYHNGNPNTFKASAAGLQEWHKMVEKFGIGSKLGIDLPSELKGNLPVTEDYDRRYKGQYSWKFSNVASLSIGEGELLISPLKLVNLAATIANRGWYITPHYIKGFGKSGVGVPNEYQEHHETDIDRQYYLPVIDGMRRAVTGGTVKALANINGIDLCGKTGTAQNAKFGHKFDHSIFVGFAPMNDPKIAVAVFVENAGWGGDAAASVAALVAERYLKRKTEAKALEAYVRSKNYMMGVKTAVKPKPVAPKNDSVRKAVAPKPYMTVAPAKVNSAAGATGN
jgi:penicillin-binding protein 2